MSKDDYHVIVYKILSYLYDCLKSDKAPDIKYLSYGTKAFPVGEKYWKYIIRNLSEDGYIRGIALINVLGQKEKAIKNIDDIEITPKGIECLRDNSSMRKAKEFLKEIGEIVPGFF